MKSFSQFPLFQSHLDLAHHYWKKIVKPGDIVIDATCGNGYDTLFLAQLLLEDEKGLLIAIDKQPEAIEAVKARLAAQISGRRLPCIRYETRCHSRFPDDLDKESVALAVYNLGYLPGGDKTMTTMCPTTHQSLEAALPLIQHGGAVSITCYPGHSEGKREEEMIIEFSSNLDPRIWSCCLHKWCNRRLSPSLLICQKAEK
jgi:tRNA G37 N-methylase Trm5